MAAPLKIAVLEDHDDLRALTMDALARAGHQVFGACDAEELDDLLAHRPIDLLLLDLNLPGEHGLSVARRLKKASADLFIIMTTAMGSLSDRVNGYGQGADLYLCKPVSVDELLAAVANIASRVAMRSTAEVHEGLSLRLSELQLVGRQIVKLTPTEASLLKMLAQASGNRVDTFRLLERTHREVNERSKASLEVQIVNLRKKINEAGFTGTAIRAIRNEGYELLCPVRVW